MPPVALVVGASRGIGRQIALDLAHDGYTVVVAAKSASDPSRPLPAQTDGNAPESTITTVQREIVAAGGSATAIQVDVRHEASVNALVDKTISLHGRLDVVVYNSGAIHWAPVSGTPLKKFQLMQQVNPEGLYAVIKAAWPHLVRSATTTSSNPSGPPSGSPSGRSSGRIVVVSPPIYSRFFRGKTAYAMGKVAMSVLTKGLAVDIDRDDALRGRLAITSLWPATAIQSAATRQFETADQEGYASQLRRPTIFSDAVRAIIAADAKDVNGHLLLDEDFLRDHEGVTDFARYSLVPGSSPRRIMPQVLPDLAVAEQDDEGHRIDQSKL